MSHEFLEFLGRPRIIQTSYRTWLVHSKSKLDYYFVILNLRGFLCTCQGFVSWFSRHKHPWCSHIRVVLEFLEAEGINSPIIPGAIPGCLNMKIEDAKLKGVGDKTIAKLKEAGYETIDQLAMATPEALAQLIGISPTKAHEIISQARSLTVPLFKASELLKLRSQKIKFISTGSSQLDAILGGGIPTEMITALAGEPASGKTQLIEQVAVNAVLDHGGIAGLVETEPGTIWPQRLIEMIKAKDPSIDPHQALEKIYVVPASYVTDINRQYESYCKLAELENLIFLGVDSFIARFRSAFTSREEFPERSREIARHIGKLEEIAATKNAAVMLSTQIMDIPDIKLQFESLVKFGTKQSPVGGKYFLHAAGLWIMLDQVRKEGLWKAFVFDAPHLPRAEAYFSITPEGIRDPTVEIEEGEFR